jgi:hypothetical protein
MHSVTGGSGSPPETRDLRWSRASGSERTAPLVIMVRFLVHVKAFVEIGNRILYSGIVFRFLGY